MLPRVQSTSSRHAYRPLSKTERVRYHTGSTYGAMIILAPDTGISGTVWPSDTGPMQLTGIFTSSSHPSSCELSCDLEAVYHEPAWLGSRTTTLLDMMNVPTVSYGQLAANVANEMREERRGSKMSSFRRRSR